MTKKKKSGAQAVRENKRGIQDGCLIIPIVLKIRISKIIRFFALPTAIFGTAYFVDIGSPIYAIILTCEIELINIIFN